MQGTGWGCAVTPAIGCNRGDALAAGASYPPITLTVNVAANAGASVTNQVSVSGGGVTGATTATDPTTIGTSAAPAAWTITKTHSGNFTQGQNGAVYTITVSNTGGGPSTFAPIAQVDNLPAGLTAVSMQGTGWTCAISPTIGCNRSDALAAGASYPPITLTVNVAANAPASVTNQVSVSGGGVAASATATDPTTIGAPGLVALTLLTSPAGFRARFGATNAYAATPISQQVAPNAAVAIDAQSPQSVTANGVTTGYIFQNWSSGGTSFSTSSAASITPTGPGSATATFAVACYTFTATPSPAQGGTVAVSPASGGLTGFPANCYAPGTSLTVTATPAAGYVNAGSASTTVILNSGNTSYTANFTLYPPPVMSFQTASYTVTGGVATVPGYLINQGTAAYNNVTITQITWAFIPASTALTNATPLPLSLGNLAAGASSATKGISVNVPATGIPPGAVLAAFISGTAVIPSTGQVVNWRDQ